ncbi:MAG: hypothetical protein DMD35_18755 [Gemmatimonadetes bacterium]|nr:MAG: hypothetical protein DMD35_18755 [Gemmatimonadota bacterium]
MLRAVRAVRECRAGWDRRRQRRPSRGSMNTEPYGSVYGVRSGRASGTGEDVPRLSGLRSNAPTWWGVWGDSVPCGLCRYPPPPTPHPLDVLESLAALNWLAVLAATAVLYVLGGLWYSPALFGPRWRAGVGFVPPHGWKPGALLYLAPLAGCFVTTLATALLVSITDAHSAADGVALGLIVGLGYAAAVAGVDATAPSHPRPGALALVVGAYWAVGLTLVAVILSVWR